VYSNRLRKFLTFHIHVKNCHVIHSSPFGSNLCKLTARPSPPAGLRPFTSPRRGLWCIILSSFEHLELSVLLSEVLLRAVKYLLSLIDVSMPFDGGSNMILA
jgi:hypothetical protein